MAPGTKNPLKILCFGDSLTAGFTNWGLVHEPYSKTTAAYLKEVVGEEYEVVIETRGVSGERVCEMGGRMDLLYGPTRTREEPYDFVVFLGGTNDIAYNRAPSDIFADIKAVLAQPLANGARVLLLTVPECGVRNR
ncbi:hypothetical protein LSUE1_G008890, partial [Lachnellula suecica]